MGDRYGFAVADLEDWLATWIDRSLCHLAEAAVNNGGLEYVITAENCSKLFNSVILEGGIPYNFMLSASPPPEWFCGQCVQEGFRSYAKALEASTGSAVLGAYLL